MNLKCTLYFVFEIFVKKYFQKSADLVPEVNSILDIWLIGA